MKKTYLSLIMLLTLAVSASAAGRIYVYDQTGWDALNVYAWADAQPELFGAWTGAAFTATEAVGEYTYKYVDVNGTDGVSYNLIFNNGTNQFDGPVYKVGETVYLYVTATAATVIADKNNPEGNKPAEPAEPETITVRAKKPAEWNVMKIWAWDSNNKNYTGGTWPGVDMTDNGNDWYCYNVPSGVSVIFNNGEGTQTANIDNVDGTKGYDVQADGKYTEVTEGLPTTECSATIVVPEEKETNFTIQVKSPAAWEGKDVYAYIYGGAEALGAWPGTKMTALKDNWYKLEVKSNSENNNIIFNNGASGDGNQVDAPENPWKEDACFEISEEIKCAKADCPKIEEGGNEGGNGGNEGGNGGNEGGNGGYEGGNESSALQNVSSVGISIYPNPVQETLHISAPANIQTVVLFNVAGQSVAEQIVNSTSTVVDMSRLAAGMYIVRIESENGTKSVQNIIKK